MRLLAGVAGTAIAGVGFALYIAAGFGTGPRDALMMLIARRAHTRIWVARTALELTVLGDRPRSSAGPPAWARSCSRSASAP